MIQLDYGPNWFYLPSMIIDAISLLVVFAIALVALRYYNLDKDRKSYLHLTISFFFISASIFFKILNNIPVYYERFIVRDFGAVTEAVTIVKSFNIFANLSFSLFVLLGLIGLYLLYNLYENGKNKRTNFIVIYLLAIISYFSLLAYYVFNLTSFIFLLFITYAFVRKCKNQDNKNTRLLVKAFATLSISSLVFMFILLDPMVYVLAELIQLIGYSILLFTLISILKHGKEKN